MAETNFMTRRTLRAWAAGVALVIAGTIAGCGSDDIEDIAGPDAAAGDANADAKSDATKDAAPTASPEAGKDGGHEGGGDATPEAAFDAGATMDATVSADASARDDADAAAPVEAAAPVDAGSEARAEASTSDASTLEVSVDVATLDVSAETSTPDSGVVDARSEAALPEAAVDARTDAQEAATPDSGVDGAASDARPSDGGQGDACITGVAACVACESDQCPAFMTGCDGPPEGPAFNAAQKAQCLALVKCIRDSSCHSNNTLDCYCGTADATQCLATSGALIANGACKAEIETAQGTTNPTAIENAYTDISNPGGAAMSLALCDTAVCNPECIPYGSGTTCHSP